jgi:hypothetical protein
MSRFLDSSEANSKLLRASGIGHGFAAVWILMQKFKTIRVAFISLLLSKLGYEMFRGLVTMEMGLENGPLPEPLAHCVVGLLYGG